MLNSGTDKSGWKNITDLIKTLSPNEKGYFRKYCAGFANSSSSTYLKMFEILDKTKHITDAGMRTQLGNKTSNIHSLRSFLYKQILKSLRAYHTEKNIQYKLREMLDYADILSDKGLHEQSRQYVEKGILLSDPVTLPAYQVLFQTQHIQLLRHYTEAEKIKKTDEIVLAITSSADIIKHSYITRQGLTKALYFVNTYFPLRNAEIKKEVFQLLKELKQVPDTEKQNYRMRNTRNSAIALLYRLLNDWEQAILYQEKTIRIIEKLDTQSLNRNIPVISAYYNYISLFVNKGDSKNYRKHLETLAQLPVTGSAEERYLKAVRLQLQLDNILFNKDFEGADAITKEAEEFILEPHPIKSIYLETLLRLSAFYIYNKEYHAALEKINLLLNTELQHTLKSFPVHVRLMNILIHSELGNTLVLPSLIRNTYRFMVKQELNFEIEQILLNFFRRVLNRISPNTLLKEFKTLHTKFQRASQNEYEKKALQYFFDYIYWLEIKLKMKHT